MGCLSCEEMRLLEERAFAEGASPEGLMEKAGLGIARAIIRRYPHPGEAVACIGSGNNGGDALVALKYLCQAGWSASVRCAVERDQLRALPRKKWRELEGCEGDSSVAHTRQCLILDGLLGIGASGPLREPLTSAAQWISDQRQSPTTDVVAMDIPSGINGDTGEPYSGAVIADLTLTVGVPKKGLLMPAAVNHTGAIETIPLEELPIPQSGELFLNDVHSLAGVHGRRPHDFHKGNAGRVGVIAGSVGMLGAAVLCSTAAVRAGGGLVTLFCEETIYPLLAAMLPPEVMLTAVNTLDEVRADDFDALAIGPGLGIQGAKENAFFDLLERSSTPVILDADGLNRIAEKSVDDCLCPGMTVTPHPGEMRRIFPESETLDRLEAASEFGKRHPGVCLLLKGTRSLITRSDSPTYVNGSGHAGMASGGQGDVLTGVLAALVGQGRDSLEASRLAAWLCGRAGEIAVSSGEQSIESLLASDVIGHMGQAFRELS